MCGSNYKRNVVIIVVVEGFFFIIFTYLLIFNPFQKPELNPIINITNEKLSLVDLYTQFNNSLISLTPKGRLLLENSDPEGEKIRVFISFGTHPELIKLFPVITSLLKNTAYEIFISYTGESDELINPLLALFSILPHVNLNSMEYSSDIVQISSKLIHATDVFLKTFFPNFVIVVGDSISALAVSTAAYLNKIPIVHIEAGLRTKDLSVPGEMNRKTLGVVCSLCFAPSILSKSYLHEEGVGRDRIIYSGSTGLDATNWALSRAVRGGENDAIRKQLKNKVNSYLSKGGNKKIIVVTCKKRDNSMKTVLEIVQATRKIAETYSSKYHFLLFILGDHDTKKQAKSLVNDVSNINVIPPVEYDIFINIIKEVYMIISDSGNIIEEALRIGVPIVSVRDGMERKEAVISGNSVSVKVKKDDIIKGVKRILNNDKLHQEMKRKSTVFGVGKAANKIVNELNKIFVLKTKRLPQLTFEFDADMEEELLEDEKVVPGSIGVILTVFQRSYTLDVLRNIYKQSIKPSEVWIWQNENHVSVNDVLKEFPHVKVVHSTANLKFHGRFALPLLMRTEYVAIFDDDLIPGNRWFENCVRVVNKYHAIAGANGRRVKLGATKYGNAQEFFNKVKTDTEVDFIGHIWFFKRKWIRYLWREPVPTYDSGEDISFSAAVQIHGGISAYIPGQPSRDFISHLKNYGGDSKATFKKDKTRQHRVRFALFNYWRKRGWSVYNERH